MTPFKVLGILSVQLGGICRRRNSISLVRLTGTRDL